MLAGATIRETAKDEWARRCRGHPPTMAITLRASARWPRRRRDPCSLDQIDDVSGALTAMRSALFRRPQIPLSRRALVARVVSPPVRPCSWAPMPNAACSTARARAVGPSCVGGQASCLEPHTRWQAQACGRPFAVRGRGLPSSKPRVAIAALPLSLPVERDLIIKPGWATNISARGSRVSAHGEGSIWSDPYPARAG